MRLLGGEAFSARKAVVANCTPYHLFEELMGAGSSGKGPAVPEWLARHVRHADYSCGCAGRRRSPQPRVLPRSPSA